MRRPWVNKMCVSKLLDSAQALKGLGVEKHLLELRNKDVTVNWIGDHLGRR
jgi:hypothetical protein